MLLPMQPILQETPASQAVLIVEDSPDGAFLMGRAFQKNKIYDYLQMGENGGMIATTKPKIFFSASKPV